MEGEGAPSWRGPGGAVRELCRSFGHYNRHLARLQHNLRETKRFFRDVKYSQGHPLASALAGDDPPSAGDGDGGPGDGPAAGGESPISFPRPDEERLQRAVSRPPCLLLLGQSCGAKCRLLNALLGQQLLPCPREHGHNGCRRRRVRFTHGAQPRLSLALPGHYELVQALVAHRGHWDTIPEEDLEVDGDTEDPAQRVAELEVVLPSPLLKEVDIVVAPCRSFQPAEATLAELVPQVLPVVTFAISEPQLSPADQAELRQIKAKFSLPIFFLCSPDPELTSPKKPLPEEKSSLRSQLLELGYLSPSEPPCGCGGARSSLAEQPDKLRLLSVFCRQLLQEHLVEAATRLNELHCRCLNIFIDQAFDMQRDLQITPKRLEYTRRKENELYESLMGIANRKQEEMKDVIVETLGNMKEELLEDAAGMEFR
ncbi:dual serine/threonine and tyrosine protein kinase-like, partial [Malurus melanocephalus]|uniref:dual serine/threonine and tyrosine protein kinase-like n=1 Tax=Malurus melanocephalus TaxID=175006 RepID=UPI0025465BC5